MRNETKLDHT